MEIVMFKKTCMKICVIMAFLFIATVVFAQSIIQIRTSSGKPYQVIEMYMGKYQGQAEANELVAKGWIARKLDREHQEIIRRVLEQYVTETGDTYVMIISQLPIGSSVLHIAVVCEFTSATTYNYWFKEKMDSFPR
jgi:predicted PurR-regulated permease PerM